MKWPYNNENIFPENVKHITIFDDYLKEEKIEFGKRLRHGPKCKSDRKLSDFVLKKTLGEGSFGRVMLANEKVTNDYYAIKCIEKKECVKTKQISHLHSEIKLLSAVDFPFIAKLISVFIDNVYIFLVFPFYNGGDFFRYLRSVRKFSEYQASFYAAQILLALQYLHYMGIIHRDLKPENILFDLDGYIKLTDFGFAKKIDNGRTYTLCGTPDYLAPEVINCYDYGKSVDFWSFGIFVYEMVAGFPPFSSFSMDRELFTKITKADYVCPSHFSRSLKDLIKSLLIIDRTKRFGLLKNGVNDIKFHSWFQNLNWEKIRQRGQKAPYVPKIKGPSDTRFFKDNILERPLRSNVTNEYVKEFYDLVT